MLSFIGHGPLQTGRRRHVLHLPAPAARQVVVVAGQLLGQLEAPVVIDAGDPTDHSGLDERGDISIGAALGQLGAGGEDLGDRQRPARPGQGGHQRLAHRGVPLLETGQAQGGLLVDGREQGARLVDRRGHVHLRDTTARTPGTATVARYTPVATARIPKLGGIFGAR